MVTIRSKTTLRNQAELPGGILRRGETAEVRPGYAEELVDRGYADIIDGDEEAPETAETDQPASGAEDIVIPEGFPHRDKLAEAGFVTVGNLRAASDEEIEDVHGIGPASREDIREALADLQ